MTVDCSKIWINHGLYTRLQDMANPCNTKQWLGPTTMLAQGSVGTVYKAPIVLKDVPKLREYYILKTQPVNEQSTREKRILRMISDDMLTNRAPLLFPFLYLDYVCENTLYMLMQPAEVTLSSVLGTKMPIELWAETLYQLSKAIYYLEEKLVNHNDLNYENIMFQHFGKDYQDMALMLIDFGSAVQGRQFVLGRDLNYFLYMLMYHGVPQGYFPKQLADELHPLLAWEDIPPHPNETPYQYGLRRANIKNANWQTSGKNISRWLARWYPFVTDRCSLERMNKLYGTGIGAIIGDALGMPIEFDYKNKQIIKKMYGSGQFKGLLAWADLPPGTFTDDTQMSLALIDAITSENRALVPSAIARQFKRWADSDPIDIGVHTKKILQAINADGSNWESVAYAAYQEKPESAANGATMRSWPIPILHHGDGVSQVVDSTLKQAQVTHMHPDAVYAAVFVSCLVHKLLNGVGLDQAIEECLRVVKNYISKQLYEVLKNAHLKKYVELRGGSGWVVHTMSVVMWAIRNTDSFATAVIRAANVPGDTDTNASITGAIAGALYGFKDIPTDWLSSLDAKNKWNYWGNTQMTVERLKDKIATLAQC